LLFSSPDGSRIVATSDDYRAQAHIWDVATATEIAVLRGHTLRVVSAAFSPGGSRVVTASWEGTARIWNAATGEEFAVLRRHESRMDSASFSPDGSRIVTASETTVRIWDAATANEIIVLPGRKDMFLSAAFSSDALRVFTVSIVGTVQVWDARFATMHTKELAAEACMRRLRGLTKLTRDEMRLAGYSDKSPEIDVCVGLE
jgi:WD40 repeat protein